MKTVLITEFKIEGDYPKFGNNDERVDEIAVQVVKSFMTKLRKHSTYRESVPTMSIPHHYFQRGIW